MRQTAETAVFTAMHQHILGLELDLEVEESRNRRRNLEAKLDEAQDMLTIVYRAFRGLPNSGVFA